MRVYSTEKHLKSITSASLYVTLSKHLNTAQVYIHGKAYLVAGYGESATQLLETVTIAVNGRQIIHEHVNSQISTSCSSILKYLDYPWDREMLRGIIGKLTLVYLICIHIRRQSILWRVVSAKNVNFYLKHNRHLG